MYNYNISYLLSKTSEEEISKIVSAAEFTVRSIIAEIGEADREDLKSVLIGEAMESLSRWYDPNRGASPSTYVSAFFKKRMWRHIYALKHRVEIIELNQIKVDEEPCHWRSLTRIIFELDIREASMFMTPTERYILFKRLRNVVRDDIRKSLNITRGKWDRFFPKWQKKAAQLLEISPTKKLKKSC